MLRNSVRDNTDDTYYNMSGHSADEISQEIKFNTVLLESISVGIPGFSDENGVVDDDLDGLKLTDFNTF